MSTSFTARALAAGAATLLVAAWGGPTAQTQSAAPNVVTGQGFPNPNPTVTKNWGQLPAGRKWGTSAGLDIDPKDGNVWGYERCGAGAGGGAGGGPVDCETNPVNPVFKFDRKTGAVLANIGKDVMITPRPRATRSTSSARQDKSC
jgi:hypothetical protein